MRRGRMGDAETFLSNCTRFALDVLKSSAVLLSVFDDVLQCYQASMSLPFSVRLRCFALLHPRTLALPLPYFALALT